VWWKHGSDVDREGGDGDRAGSEEAKRFDMKFERRCR